MHILKGNIGSGVFAMGDAFKNGGLILSPILTIFLGVICVHSQHILVTIFELTEISRADNDSIQRVQLKCSHRLKVKLGHDQNPDFAETVEMCFECGPPRIRGWSKTVKFIVNVFLCITQMGFCCIYFVFISSSLKQVRWGIAVFVMENIFC